MEVAGLKSRISKMEATNMRVFALEAQIGTLKAQAKERVGC